MSYDMFGSLSNLIWGSGTASTPATAPTSSSGPRGSVRYDIRRNEIEQGLVFDVYDVRDVAGDTPRDITVAPETSVFVGANGTPTIAGGFLLTVLAIVVAAVLFQMLGKK